MTAVKRVRPEPPGPEQSIRDLLLYNETERKLGGVTCVGCGGRVQEYHRRLHSGEVRLLAEQLAVGGTTEPFKMQDVLGNDTSLGRDSTLLVKWGLIRPDLRHTGKKGWYVVTEAGAEFVRGESTVPLYAWVYRNEVQEFDGPQVTFRECLGSKFDFNQVLSDTRKH